MKRSGLIRILSSLLKLSRPKQWLKSLLILVPPIISGEIIYWTSGNIVDFFKILIIFTLAAIGIYTLNDLIDIKKDRLHPRKKFRPLASSEISAVIVLIFLIAISSLLFAGFYDSSNEVQIIIGSYLTINILYITLLKHVPYWEMLAVSSGFVLRALAGTTLVSKEPSKEFFVIIFFGSLLIVVAKRLAEFKHTPQIQRKVLAHYTQENLRSIISLSIFVIIAAYCLFIFSSYFVDISRLGTIVLYASIFPFMVIMFIIQGLAFSGELEAPETALAKNVGLFANSIIWIILFITYSYLKG
jgi:decaprenyl-phosphate phosphoribosyltransferase